MLSNPTADGSPESETAFERCHVPYTMAELVARSDYSQPQPPEEREWI